MYACESRSVMSDSWRPHLEDPTRLLYNVLKSSPPHSQLVEKLPSKNQSLAPKRLGTTTYRHYSGFPSFFTNALLLFQDTVPNFTLHLVSSNQ